MSAVLTVQTRIAATAQTNDSVRPQLGDDDCALLLTGAESFSGAAVRRPSGGLLVTLGDRCGVGSFSWSR